MPPVDVGTCHELKCWPDFFVRVVSGEKTFEIRKADREYHAGDQLWLREWHPGRQEYTGRGCVVDVTYLLGGEWPGLMEGYVVMSISLVERAAAEAEPLNEVDP